MPEDEENGADEGAIEFEVDERAVYPMLRYASDLSPEQRRALAKPDTRPD